jgi:uncharacterized protein RhaS with RHS repeats
MSVAASRMSTLRTLPDRTVTSALELPEDGLFAGALRRTERTSDAEERQLQVFHAGSKGDSDSIESGTAPGCARQTSLFDNWVSHRCFFFRGTAQ